MFMRIGLVAVILGSIGLLIWFGLSEVTFGSAQQPIAFNHQLHVGENGMECTDCHLYAETGVRATIPNLEVCSGCHTEESTGSADEARLLEHINNETPIPWEKVYWVPPHVYFSHRRHTSMAQLDCEICHGAVGERSTPVSEQAVEITMDRCMDCHYETGTTNDCIACHR